MNHTLPPSKATRRLFLQHAGAMGALAGAGAPMALNLLAAGSASAQAAPDYKAIVCLFLFGGNDSNNTVIPMDDASYKAYTSIRGNLALTGAALAPTVTDVNGAPDNTDWR